MNSKPNTPHICKKDWLTNEIITYLETKKPTFEYKAGDIMLHDVVVYAFQTLFPAVLHGENGYQWLNQISWNKLQGKFRTGTDLKFKTQALTSFAPVLNRTNNYQWTEKCK